MADPYNAKEVLLELINLTDGLNAAVADVTFGIPSKVTDPTPPKNTKILITPKTESGFYGIKTVYYNRIHIGEVGAMSVERDGASSHLALIPALNLKYGLYLTADDIIDKLIPPGDTGLITVVLQINPNSLTWYDGAVIVTTGP